MFSTLLAGGLLAAIATVAGAGINAYSQYKTNKANQEINQQNLDYNKAQTEAAWSRDDTAHQREVADLEAAGLSPLASTSGASVTSPLGAPSPIAMQAPQVDLNGLINAALTSDKLKEEKRHNLANEGYKEEELKLSAEENKIKADELDLGNRELNERIRYQTNLNKLAADNLAELTRHSKEQEKIELTRAQALQLNAESEKIATMMKQANGGRNVPVKFTSDINIYSEQVKIRTEAETTLLKNLAKLNTREASANSSNESTGFGLGLGGKGANGSNNYNVASANSNYHSEDRSKTIQFMIDEFNQNFPVYVYVPKGTFKYYEY